MTLTIDTSSKSLVHLLGSESPTGARHLTNPSRPGFRAGSSLVAKWAEFVAGCRKASGSAGWGCLGPECAVVDDCHSVGESLRLLQVVSGEDHGLAFLAVQGSNQLPQASSCLWIEPGGWLVEKLHIGVIHERRGHRESTGLTSERCFTNAALLSASPTSSSISPDSACCGYKDPRMEWCFASKLAPQGPC